MAGTKKIPLSKGAVAVVDEDDYDRLMAMGSWYLSDTGYAVRRETVDGNTRTVRMHRVVNDTPEHMFTDHLNNDKLDNRRSNLRAATQKENMNNLSTAKGYCWDKEKEMWMVRYKGKFYGRYETEEEAAEAYRMAESGVEKPNRQHPRRKYLPKGVMYMKSQAEKDKAPYYIRPQIDGERIFDGYFDTPKQAEQAYHKLKTARKRG